jgi:hypothetical protein
VLAGLEIHDENGRVVLSVGIKNSDSYAMREIQVEPAVRIIGLKSHMRRNNLLMQHYDL